MTCPRCQGCVIWSDEPVSRFGSRTITMQRCLNCGDLSDAHVLRQRRLMHPMTEDRQTQIWQRIQHLVARAI